MKFKEGNEVFRLNELWKLTPDGAINTQITWTVKNDLRLRNQYFIRRNAFFIVSEHLVEFTRLSERKLIVNGENCIPKSFNLKLIKRNNDKNYDLSEKDNKIKTVKWISQNRFVGMLEN